MERARKCHNLDIWSLRTRPSLNCSRGLDWTKGCVNEAESIKQKLYRCDHRSPVLVDDLVYLFDY